MNLSNVTNSSLRFSFKLFPVMQSQKSALIPIDSVTFLLSSMPLHRDRFLYFELHFNVSAAL